MVWELKKAFASPTYFGQPKASITGVTRLETHPAAVNLKIGLQAALADPLWMLSRQWQFNEFQGEDAGTPLNLAFSVEGTSVDFFRSGHDAETPWEPLAQGGAPLEARVEAEAVWKTHARLRGEAGLHALRLLPSAAARAALLAAYAMALDAPTDPQADMAGLLWSTLFNARTVDALRLADDLRPLDDGAGGLTALPAALNIQPADASASKTALAAWLTWLDELAYEGPGKGTAENPSWQKNRMEYAFSLKSGKVVLKADEYTDGHLDWDDFRAEPAPAGNADPAGGAPPVQPVQAFSVASRHPSPVRYPGMPAERYWEFEDGNVSFAGAEAGVTDMLRMTITEFALTFGNDWFVVPVRLPLGALYRVASFQVTDTFGIPANVGPISAPGNQANPVPWTMFEMTANANLQRQLRHSVFLPDSVDGVQEGAVLEHTFLVRDEMANLAWAIEKKVQGVSGEPLDRDMEAKALSFQQQIDFKSADDSPQLVYRLATPVPANWTPLLPVRPLPLNPLNPLAIQLERAGMKRFYPEASVEMLGSVDPAYTAFLDGLDAQKNFIKKLEIDANLRAYVFYPRGHLLRNDPEKPMPDTERLLIEEEEVPRIGASLKRKFQYARSSDGKSWLWVGRSKTAGHGEAASQLRFDVAVKAATLR
jgi:hypothetical protein